MALDPKQVEVAVLLEVVELHPDHLTPDELVLRMSGERGGSQWRLRPAPVKVVADPEDRREIETGVKAIHDLREAGLFTHRDDGIVEPTPAALRAVALLT
jgi:hypothetical protein